MTRDSLYRRIITADGDLWTAPARGLLRAGSMLYGLGVTLRNRRFAKGGSVRRLPIPVISVGNLTVGGTGKTPFVIDLVNRLDALGFSPAVLSRGYKAVGDEPNDEERLIRSRCPQVVCVSDADRVRGGEMARERYGADVLVLDDGFQHRRLARDLDIVLLDATCPFGHGHLLPRGLLREPPSALRRAHLIALTRCDQVSPAALDRVRKQVESLAPGIDLIQCSHRVTALTHLDGTPLADSPTDRRAVLFAGIGRPQAFETTVRALGIEVVGTHWWPDHFAYSVANVDALRRSGRFPAHDWLVTTEKDAVKLRALPGLNAAGIVVVTIDIDFHGRDGTMLQAVLERTLGRGKTA